MRYRRVLIPGASYFFTVNLVDRSSRLLVDRVADLREVVRDVRDAHPFAIVAWVVLPDHLHAVWTLPEGDADYATRWGLIKAGFSRRIPKEERIRASRARKGERGIWQRRFWEHLIRDDRDLARHVDYIHWNPVKHGYVDRAVDWPYSTFHRDLRRGHVTAEWGVREDVGVRSSPQPTWAAAYWTREGVTMVAADTDGDGIPDDLDNCPLIANSGQVDLDVDGVGDVCDVCDSDIDGDGMSNDLENTRGLNPRDPADALLDSDGDGWTNLGESLAGTDPYDANSLPVSDRLVGLSRSGVCWSNRSGHCRPVVGHEMIGKCARERSGR